MAWCEGWVTFPEKSCFRISFVLQQKPNEQVDGALLEGKANRREEMPLRVGKASENVCEEGRRRVDNED